MSYDFSLDDDVFFDDFFGTEAVFQALSGGDPVDVTIIIDNMQNAVPDGFDFDVLELMTTVNAPFSAVGLPVRGDTFTVGAVLYTVERVVSNNEFDITCSVIESVALVAYVPPTATGYIFSDFQNSQYLGTL